MEVGELALYLYTVESKPLSELDCNYLCKWDDHISAVIISLECEQGFKIFLLLEELLFGKQCIYSLFLIQVLNTSIINPKIVGGIFYQCSLN